MLLDTSGFLCYVHQDEPQHQEAVQFFSSTNKKFLTHSYILAELIALALIRRFPRPAVLAFVMDLLMIIEHHKIREYRGATYPLVELFRKGDLVDFSFGMIKFGIPKTYIKEVKTKFPNSDFHKNLGKRAAKWFLKHPLNPVPMMKW